MFTKNFFKFLPRCIISRNYQVTIVGGASEIGQTVGLLLRTQPSITKLVVHDYLEQTPGVVLDLSHVPINSSLQGYIGQDNLERSLKNSDLVIVTGGDLQQPGLSQKAIFNSNTVYIKKLAATLGKISPMPFIGIVTEPINVLVPMAAEIMKNHGGYDQKKLFGIASADFLRAQALYAADNNLNPPNCFIPVIGGNSEETILPLLSQAKPTSDLQSDERKTQKFISKFRSQVKYIREAKGGWSPTISIAFGVLTFVQSILDALNGRANQLHAYVENNDFGTSFFSGLLVIDENGIVKMQRYSNLSKLECHLLERSIQQLRKDVLVAKKMLELA